MKNRCLCLHIAKKPVGYNLQCQVIEPQLLDGTVVPSREPTAPPKSYSLGYEHIETLLEVIGCFNGADLIDVRRAPSEVQLS
jgi:hypothetical protein